MIGCQILTNYLERYVIACYEQTIVGTSVSFIQLFAFISNTVQLQFLMLKGPDDSDHKVECVEHTEKFWHWLKSKGISSHRSAIVRAVAEKSATFFNGIYDANNWEDEDDEEE